MDEKPVTTLWADPTLSVDGLIVAAAIAFMTWQVLWFVLWVWRPRRLRRFAGSWPR